MRGAKTAHNPSAKTTSVPDARQAVAQITQPCLGCSVIYNLTIVTKEPSQKR